MYYCYGNIGFIHTYKTIIQLHSTNKIASSREKKKHIIGIWTKAICLVLDLCWKCRDKAFILWKWMEFLCLMPKTIPNLAKVQKLLPTNTPICINIPRKLQQFCQKMWNFDVNINFQRIFCYFRIQCFEWLTFVGYINRSIRRML